MSEWWLSTDFPRSTSTPKPFLGSQLMPPTWPITLGYRRGPGFMCLHSVVAGLAERAAGPSMPVLMVWVGPAIGSKAQQHQRPHRASSAVWLGLLFPICRPCRASAKYCELNVIAWVRSFSASICRNLFLLHATQNPDWIYAAGHLPPESFLFRFKSHAEKYLGNNWNMFCMALTYFIKLRKPP